MRRPKVYLAGPIFGRSDEECSAWRETAKRELRDVAIVVDPMDRDYRGREDVDYERIVRNDKKNISICEAMLVYHDGPSVGTAMEVHYAYDLGYVKVALAMPDTSAPLSPWMRYHAGPPMTLDEAIAAVREHCEKVAGIYYAN